MKKAMKIIRTIRKNGGEAYLVGGCVRDMILKRSPNDFDIATNLLPQDIIKMFKKVIPTGIEHLSFDTFLLNRTLWFRWQEIKKQDSVMKVTDLAVNGHDMMNLGFEGKEISNVMKAMLEKIDSDELTNDRKELINFAKNLS